VEKEWRGGRHDSMRALAGLIKYGVGVEACLKPNALFAKNQERVFEV
jgi:hypothetical protein